MAPPCPNRPTRGLRPASIGGGCAVVRHRLPAFLLAAVLLAAGAGCRRDQVAQHGVWGAPPAAAAGQLAGVPGPPGVNADQLKQRAALLDTSNQQMHEQLATAQQQNQALREQVALLQQRLSDTASQMQEAITAREAAEKELLAVKEAQRFRGGATLTANNSVRTSLAVIDIPGLEVRQQADVIRIAIPADRLFVPGTVSWQAGATTILDDVAGAVSQHYGRQIIGIEGHHDSTGLNLPGGAHQLTASQTLAVHQHLVSRNRLPQRQLFTMAYGANHPVASNGTVEGRARNRRIELVVYPEVLE